MTKFMPELVSTSWLDERLVRGDIAVLDATRHLPGADRDARAEFQAAHIPGAMFLDLDTLTDETSAVPYAVPSAEQLQHRLADAGVAPGTGIVVYDDSSIKSAARAWFILKAHGIENAAILDGGFGKWRAEDRAIQSGARDAARAEPFEMDTPSNVADKDEMLTNLETGREQVIDARGADRVFGIGDDPVHGGANGRIPGSLNVPYTKVFNEDGTYRSPEELRATFKAAGVDLDRPVVTTCGSGITASVLLFALHLIGKDDVRLYDGSWSEWSKDPATPKAQGPA